MPFDSTVQPSGTALMTGLAISNADPALPAVITCQAHDFVGNQLGQGLQIPPLAPFAHTSFILQTTAPFQPVVANTRGLLVCASTTSISAIGIRVLGETVSSLPVTITP